MKVRPATPADAASIAQIHVITWQAAYRGQIPDSILDALNVPRRAAFWTERVAEGQGRTLVAESSVGIVGFCDLIPSRDKDADPTAVAEIAALYIHREHWRKGVGRELCTHASREAQAQSYGAGRPSSPWTVAPVPGRPY